MYIYFIILYLVTDVIRTVLCPFIMTVTNSAVSEVVMAELLWVQVLRHVTLCCWESGVAAFQRTVLASKCLQPLTQ
jgi:hypothetical protein